MADKNRAIYILKYLLDHTDEEHPAVIREIMTFLEEKGISSNRKTVAEDLRKLQDSGFDVICNRRRQNQYFIGSRNLELAELKLIIDAVQAAKFISQTKTRALIERISGLASPYQAEELKRKLYVEGKEKTTNEGVLYTVDLLHYAINHKKAVEFQYFGYTADKEKSLKHDGCIYRFSPYDQVWDNDRYYVFGWSERHEKIVKFRVDRMIHIKESAMEYHRQPEGYDIEAYCNQVFLMFDGEQCTIQLLCENGMMNTIVDRFGNEVKTRKIDDQHFLAEAEVYLSPTFYSWIFAYEGAIAIASPQAIVDEYKRRLEEAVRRIE